MRETVRSLRRKVRVRRVPSGFTLVEILAALAILMIGLGAIIAMLLGTGREGAIASDRNAAALMLSEAVRGIEREHLITKELCDAQPGLMIPITSIGILVETVTTSALGDDNATYAAIPAYGGTLGDGNEGNLNTWPRMPGKPQQYGAGQYRVRYRLERHPDWVPAPAADVLESPQRGLYLLTLVVYKDEAGDMSSPVQISDPITVLLRDRVVR